MSLIEIPDCPYCGKPSAMTTGAVLYPQLPDFADRPYHACLPCKAWVGCHPGGTLPLGRLANGELRLAKQAAHNAFDPLWKAKMRRDGCTKRAARGAGYAWLASKLGIPPEECHIGMFDVATCRRVVAVCKNPNKPEPKQADLLEER